jgi:hypothetical protein
VTISDSFQAAVRHLVSELGGAVIDGRPHAGEPWPDADATLILAGGEESAGVDLLVDSKPGGPRFLIGAAADHRIAAAALQNGAADYFALPADLELLRRRLEREGRRSEGRLEAERFAEGERQTSGFQTILGGSPALRQTLDQARLKGQGGQPGRFDDSSLQLGLGQWPQVDQVLFQQTAQLGTQPDDFAIKIGSQGDDDPDAAARISHGGVEQIQELDALSLIGQQSKDFLELVNHQRQFAAIVG